MYVITCTCIVLYFIHIYLNQHIVLAHIYKQTSTNYGVKLKLKTRFKLTRRTVNMVNYMINDDYEYILCSLSFRI